MFACWLFGMFGLAFLSVNQHPVRGWKRPNGFRTYVFVIIFLMFAFWLFGIFGLAFHLLNFIS